MERGVQMTAVLAAGEVLIVFGGILLFIWRLQYTFPNFAILLLGFLIVTFFIHRDRFADLGFGSRGFGRGMKVLAGPTLLLATVLLVIGIERGALNGSFFKIEKLAGLGHYFAWCLFQEFGLQSFFTNRLRSVFKRPNRTAWVSAAIFAAFHIPNPVLMPITFLGGYVLSRVFISTRNLVPIALAQAIIGSLLSLVLPVSWHHGLRVGPGYYR
jgi:hypothetical protein